MIRVRAFVYSPGDLFMRYLPAACFAAQFLILPIHAQSAPISPYGVCAHLARGGEFKTQTEELGLMNQAGIAWARSDFDWSGVQPTADTWSFEHLDTVVSNAEKAGVQMLPILDYNVSFAYPAYLHLDQWENYVRTLVGRYRTRLPVWEVWNEQNLEGFWKNANPQDYLTLLKRTYETVKSVDPKLTVAVGGFAGVPTNFIDRLYQAGGAKYFDIMNVHPYGHPSEPETYLENQLAGLKSTMAKYGDAAKPVWITEIGWPTQKQRAAAPGLIKAGLKAARPDKTDAWRIAVIDDPSFSSDHSTPSDAILDAELPADSRVQRLSIDALYATLAASDVDAVVLPFNENFPADGFDKLVGYVRRGGILIECGGMPVWNPMTRGADGKWTKSKLYGEQFRDQLRIGVEAWWYKKGVIPEELAVKFVGPATGIPQPEKGFTAERFLTPLKFKEGDRFIPLLAGEHNGYTGTAAAVFAFNSDLKGAVIVSALFERGQRGNSEAEQAMMLPRALLIAYQLGVARSFWYEFQSPETDDLDQESHFGVLHLNLSPKPAYLAFKTLTAQRPAGSVGLSLPWKSADGALYYPQWRLPDGRSSGAVWAYQKPGLYKLTFSCKGVTLTTHTGSTIVTAWDRTACTLPLTGAPVYFAGATLEEISAVK